MENSVPTYSFQVQRNDHHSDSNCFICIQTALIVIKVIITILCVIAAIICIALTVILYTPQDINADQRGKEDPVMICMSINIHLIITEVLILDLVSDRTKVKFIVGSVVISIGVVLTIIELIAIIKGYKMNIIVVSVLFAIGFICIPIIGDWHWATYVATGIGFVELAFTTYYVHLLHVRRLTV